MCSRMSPRDVVVAIENYFMSLLFPRMVKRSLPNLRFLVSTKDVLSLIDKELKSYICLRNRILYF